MPFLGVLSVMWGLGGCSNGADEGDDGSAAGTSSNAGKSSAGGAQGNGGSGKAGANSSGGKASGGSDSPPVTSDFPEAQIYVDAHNAVRAAVEKPANYSGTWAPLPPVSWSDEVAASALGWADHLRDTMGCGLAHADGTGYGENLAAGTNVGAQRAVDLWANEKKNYTYSPEYVFMSNTGHYTQIVWRKSTRIGCASADCGSSSVVACRYDPPGNFIGDDIF